MNYPNVLTINKKVGETPLEALERAREKHLIPQNLPMTYAGRLDPLADGLLLVLVGEECKHKDKYLGLDKVYETEIVFGISTDTYDALGMPVVGENHVVNVNWQKYVGKFIQEYPPFSSKPVGGKALFAHSRQGTLGEIELPKKEVEIYSIRELSSRKISAEKLQELVLEKISKVHGDFRQKQIVESWKKVFEKLSQEGSVQFSSFLLNVHASSGTYIRSLAHRVGKELGTGGFAQSITRKIVGNYRLE